MQELKVGDTLYRFYMGRVTSKTTIERITKTKVILSDKTELRNSDNPSHLKRINAGKWDTVYYSTVTPEIEEKFNRRRLQRYVEIELVALSSTSFDKYSTEQLLEIVKLVKAIKSITDDSSNNTVPGAETILE